MGICPDPGTLAYEAYENRDRILESMAARARWQASGESREKRESFPEFLSREDNDELIANLQQKSEVEGVDISDIIADIEAEKYSESNSISDLMARPSFWAESLVDERIKEARQKRELR
jgi:hypothetical protein